MPTSSDDLKVLQAADGEWTVKEYDPYEVMLRKFMERSFTDFEWSLDSYLGKNALRGSSYLETVSLPCATYVNNYMFLDCPSLKQVMLPMVSRIGAGAFQCGSNNNVKVIMPANTVCVYDGGSQPPSTMKFYVPDGLLNSYKSATNWSAIASQILAMSSLVM